MNNKKGFWLMSISILIFLMAACTEKTNNSAKESDMKSQNPVKYLYNANPFYVHWKKHACPKCEAKLKTTYNSVVVNSDSPEAKDYDFSVGDSYLKGDVEFRTSYFRCPECGFEIAFDEMKKLENEK